MPTGTKIAAIVAVVLLAAAGLYYAFVAPATPNNRTPQPAPSGANGLSSQSPATLAPAPAPSIPTVGAPPSAASTTPAIGTLGQLPTASGPTPTGLSAGTGAAAGREQPGFAPGSLSSSTGGKGDAMRPTQTPGGTINGFPSAGSGATGLGTPAPATAPTGAATAPASATARTTPSEGGPRPTPTGPAGSVPASPISIGSSAAPEASPATRPTSTAAGAETTHTVASGETLSSIAKRYLGSENAWRSIAKANPSVDPTAMKIGTKLKIPARDAAATTASSSGTGTTTTPARATAAPSGSASDLHVVASGDTLASIARRYYGNSKHWQKIYDVNRGVIGSDPAALKIGQRLNLPAKTVVVGGENVER
jgi:nucleoid-associated protein YgaU